jgi:FtsZ-binding cell division protein ZapB
MAKTMTAGAGVGVEPFDRLEEKVKLLVGTIARLKGEQTRLADDNTRLQRELASMQERVQQAEHAAAELMSLREERDVIRNRVGDMLAELDGLNL